VVALLFVSLLWVFVCHGLRFPVGPDAPVYVWWMRAAGHDGLSVIGQRPGTPALMLTVAGTLHLSPATVTAALEAALGVAVGLASCGLARGCRGTSRVAWVLAGLLAGMFSVHLAAGYLSNLMFAVGFLGACASVSVGRRRATAAAALLLGAAGLAHPQFWIPGAAILALVAAWALFVRRDGAEFARFAWVIGGGGALVVAGLVAMLVGPARLAVDTSRDGFLRRVGLGDVVRGAYLDRFVHRWTRYVQWISLPLAAAGSLRARDTGGRILRAWLVVIVAGIPVGLLTGLFPADRLITFGYAVPILAGFGTVWLHGRLAATRIGPKLALAACAILVAAMAAGSFIAWHRQDPFIDETQTDQLEVLNRYVAAAPPGTPILVPVDPSDQTVTFRATTTANVVRAAMPPGREGDVVVVVPPFAGPQADAERSRLTDVTSREATDAIARADGRAIIAALGVYLPLENPAAAGAPDRAAAGVWLGGAPATPAALPVDPLEPSSPAAIVLASMAVLALLWATGYGWARTAMDATAAAALAPAFGLAALTLAALVLERCGVPLDGWIGPTIVSAVAAGGGYASLLVLGAEREIPADPPAQVQQ
jgi:hypothetical protein